MSLLGHHKQLVLWALSREAWQSVLGSSVGTGTINRSYQHFKGHVKKSTSQKVSTTGMGKNVSYSHSTYVLRNIHCRVHYFLFWNKAKQRVILCSHLKKKNPPLYSKKIDMDPCTHILTSINRNPQHAMKETRELEPSCQFSTFGRMLKQTGKGKK